MKSITGTLNLSSFLHCIVMTSFGVIGIGFMGRGIAKNAILKGSNIGLKSVSLYDVNQSQIQQLLNEEVIRKAQTPTKVEVLDKATDVFRRHDIVALSLPSEEVCKSLLFDAKEGIVTNMKAVSLNSQKIIIDHSTYSKKFVQYCSEKAKDIAGVEYIDAPVFLVLLYSLLLLLMDRFLVVR